MFFGGLWVLAIAAGVAFSYDLSAKSGNLSYVTLANIEALAQGEQPNVDDCKKDPNYDCEALHPTDPSQDKYRENARW